MVLRLGVPTLAFIMCSLLIGCGGGSTTTLVAPAAPVAIAGEYAGPVSDSAVGAESGDIVLAQHGTSLGGAMTLVAGSASVVESVSLIETGTSLAGTGVMDVNGAACTFSITGTYANNAIAASYVGVSGCTRTGSWSLTQTCVGTPQSVDRRPEGVLPHC